MLDPLAASGFPITSTRLYQHLFKDSSWDFSATFSRTWPMAAMFSAATAAPTDPGTNIAATVTTIPPAKVVATPSSRAGHAAPRFSLALISARSVVLDRRGGPAPIAPRRSPLARSSA